MYQHPRRRLSPVVWHRTVTDKRCQCPRCPPPGVMPGMAPCRPRAARGIGHMSAFRGARSDAHWQAGGTQKLKRGNFEDARRLSAQRPGGNLKRERDERSLTSRLVYSESSNLPAMSSGVAPPVLVAGRTAPAEAEVEAGRRFAGRQAPAEKRVWGVILHQLVVAASAGPSGRGDSRSRVLVNSPCGRPARRPSQPPDRVSHSPVSAERDHRSHPAENLGGLILQWQVPRR